MLANPRHVRIAWIAGMATMLAGGFAFDASNEGQMQAVGMVGFVVVFVVFHFLDERERRRKRKRPQ
jgi:hypothetical protein